MAEFAGKKGKKGGEAQEGPRFGRVKANLKMGVLGLPNVGKSSLFNLLTEQAVAAENYPFCTIDPNESRCPVPDQRFEWLCDFWQPVSRVPAYLHITDIAGLIKGASTGAGLGNAFLSHIQAVDGLYHVIRAFENPEVVHVDDSVDPIRDLDTITYELCRKDQVYVEGVHEKKLQDVKRDPKNKPLPVYYSVMEKVKEMLEKNQPLRTATWGLDEVNVINTNIPLAITLKPIVYLVNVDSASFKRKSNKWFKPIDDWVKSHGGGTVIPMSVEWEQGLWNLREDAEKREKYLTEVEGLKSMLPRIVKVGYNVLNLRYFFTAGEPEVRCWTIPAGACAPEAAGAIHTDFERGFIKAEIVSYDDFKTLATNKSMANVKAAGKYRQEGKTYVVQDGDIIHFMFNVTNSAKKK
jgi:obg-like ATPase 1